MSLQHRWHPCYFLSGLAHFGQPQAINSSFQFGEPVAPLVNFQIQMQPITFPWIPLCPTRQQPFLKLQTVTFALRPLETARFVACFALKHYFKGLYE